MSVNKGELYRWGCVKMLMAFFRISLSWRNISFSRRKCLISSSIVVWCPFPGSASCPCSPAFLAPLTQRTVRNAEISGNLCFVLPATFKQMNGLLLEFFCVGWLRFAHRILLIPLYQISLLLLPKSGSRSRTCCPLKAVAHAANSMEREI